MTTTTTNYDALVCWGVYLLRRSESAWQAEKQLRSIARKITGSPLVANDLALQAITDAAHLVGRADEVK